MHRKLWEGLSRTALLQTCSGATDTAIHCSEAVAVHLTNSHDESWLAWFSITMPY
jgi:hypothetical protein